MDSKPIRQEEATLIVTIDAQCDSLGKSGAYNEHQELSEECLTVLAQGRAAAVHKTQQPAIGCMGRPLSLHDVNTACLLLAGADGWEQQEGLSFDEALTKYVGEFKLGQVSGSKAV